MSMKAKASTVGTVTQRSSKEMSYYLLLLQFFFALIALFLLGKSIRYFLHMRRYQQLRSKPLPPSYLRVLETLSSYRILPPHLQTKIHTRILFFIDQKEFVGAGMVITPKMQVVIAFYASLVRLGFDLDSHDNVRTIILYPSEFVVDDPQTLEGIRYKHRPVLEGESAGGTVVLSWKHILQDIRQGSKENVIIHEFAHELDIEDGMQDGTPELQNATDYPRYAAAFGNAFIILTKQTKRNLITKQSIFLGSYALENEAEFFAVCSERFFMAPKSMQELFPAIYEELKGFYRLDTVDILHSL